MKKRLMVMGAVCVCLAACATTKASREALAKAQRDIQNAEYSFSAAKNAGAETYAAVNYSTARIELQAARNELDNKKYNEASVSARNSIGFSNSAINETEAARKKEAEEKVKQAEEARRKAAEERAKVKSKSGPSKTAKPEEKKKPGQPDAKTKAAAQTEAPKKEEPKKKSWWSW